MFKHKKLNNQGMSHHLLMMVVVALLVASFGAYRVYTSRANSISAQYAVAVTTEKGCTLAGRKWSSLGCGSTCPAGVAKLSVNNIPYCKGYVSTTVDSQYCIDGYHRYYVKNVGCARRVDQQSVNNAPQCVPGYPKYVVHEGFDKCQTNSPAISSFIATPRSVLQGNTTVLSWITTNTDSCSVTPGGPVGTSTTSWTTPVQTVLGTQTVTLACTGNDGTTVSKTTSFSVLPAYTNPVIKANAPDPTIIRAEDGTYHLYSTGGTATNPFKHYVSVDMVNWSVGGRVMDNVPPWLASERWAPHVAKVGSHYVLTFSGGGFGGGCDNGVNKRRIGYATAATAAGPFYYRGVLINDNANCGYDIDPMLADVGNGKLVLYYGSGVSISAVDISISTDGRLSKSGTAKVVLTKGTDPTLIEGPWFYRHGSYYYLFYSAGAWSSKSGSTEYRTMVARSTSPTGTFTKKGIPVLRGADPLRGPGHNAVIADRAGTDWLVYHAWFGSDNVRSVSLDAITWQNDWPTVSGGNTPSTVGTKPQP